MNCLLLNKDYTPISILPLSIVNWQHALKLHFLDRITILESYDNHVARSASLTIHYPAVAVTNHYFNNKKKVKFSRQNMYLRDLFTCAYCDETFDYHELTIDHVIPRALGGRTNWENAVTACKSCNHKKGDKLHMQPKTLPYRPEYWSLVSKWKSRPVRIEHPSWYQYLGIEPYQD